MLTLTVTEMARNFSEYVNRVAYQGEQLLLTRGRKTVAEVRPVLQGVPLGELFTLLDGFPKLSAEENQSFAEDLKQIRQEANQKSFEDPWES